MERHDSVTSAYTDVLMFLGNINTINYFRRISFWGTVMLLINVFVMKIPSSMILGGPYSSDLYLKGYHGFLLWSVISLVILFFVTILFFAFYLPHYGDGAYNVFQYMGKQILYDFLTPFRVLKDCFTKDENGKRSFAAFVRLITMIVFIVVNIIAVIKTI